jgi:3-hydroxybutyryl-CoA dehydrogenase
VIGTGMMGPGIALTLALGGWRTTILSRGAGKMPPAALEKARSQALLLADRDLIDRACAAEAAESLIERLRPLSTRLSPAPA